ncbi:class I SAM-dependent methyltransferase [Pseudohalocynthiibacter sp. F2068]|uniref:class I SAM-dependent methyltransferase n=1 Tax=Pseudohalocynthiibacter sp. F2068 TaxID=2926418 RepID=UPI001FF63C01|nr:class I SAM-dependent methyltransferase [Pseudohalocynthiibacter sp. F2068]MCK0101170.1 class I SAM-dependent methyltransferase [Pseudohalocynthiibacter sp. F2068]
MNSHISLPDAATLETPDCPICESRRNAAFIEGEDDLGGNPGRFTFVTCTDCGLVYQSPRLTIDAIKPYYDEEYIAHRKKSNWGVLTSFYEWAMGKLDREKMAIVGKVADLGPGAKVLDVGCGAGSFLAMVRSRTGANCTGVDFKDMSGQPWLEGVEYRHGTLCAQDFGDEKFDLITMWHFLEHDYEPRATLEACRNMLAPGGKLVIEVPRLDSLSFRIFGDRWPGLQAPQHTMLLDKAHLNTLLNVAGLRSTLHHSYGAFPAYFYFFLGSVFKVQKGKGLNFNSVIYPYFLGQVLTLPVFLFEKRLNLAMQTVVCEQA